MPIRVGIDLTSVELVRDSIIAHGDHYLERVYTQNEILDSSSDTGVDPKRLAARFAAKEATFKVLRVGDQAIGWRDVEVRRHSSGWVELILTGRAATLAGEAGITELALSLTHEQGFAAAVVIADTDRFWGQEAHDREDPTSDQ